VELNADMMGRVERSKRFREAIRRIDVENAQDPHSTKWEGQDIPYQLFYSQRLSEWVQRLCPNASEAVMIAARAQHISRWRIPRSNYPMTRAGYLKWRTDLKKYHAQKSADILEEIGYDPATIARVQALNLKKDLSCDPETQVLEDALCLVTLEHQLDDLMRKTKHEKLVSILRKTWRKMSPAGQEAALRLPYPKANRELIEEALSG
jgi:hypothetical protein